MAPAVRVMCPVCGSRRLDINCLTEECSMNKIHRTWSLMGACWQLLSKDKGLLLFPLISGICCMLLLASFAVPLYFTNHWQPPGGDAAATQQMAYYGTLFL